MSGDAGYARFFERRIDDLLESEAGNCSSLRKKKKKKKKMVLNESWFYNRGGIELLEVER